MTSKKGREQNNGNPGWKRFLNNQQDYLLGAEEVSWKKCNNCYDKKQSCLLIMMMSYTVKIGNNTKSSYHMLLRKQFTESCISTWLILVQIELYSSSGKGFTEQKWRKGSDILLTTIVHV